MSNLPARNNDGSHALARVLYLDDRDHQYGKVREVQAASGWSYGAKLGREIIWLEPVEFSILCFLSAKPYRAFRPARIAKAVTTERLPVTVDTLPEHIASLRDKLGFFGDYIQSVPHIGYRFKA